MSERDELEALRRLQELEARAKAEPAEPSRLPGFLKEAGLTAVRGAGLGVLGILESLGGGNLDPKTLKPVENTLVKKGREALDRWIPPQEGLFYRGMEGLGGGALAGPRGAIPGAAGALASDATYQGLEGTVPEKVRQIAALVAGGAVGAGAGYAFGPKKPGTPESNVKRDTGTLTQLSLNRVGQEVDPLAVANRTSDVANDIIAGAKRDRSDIFGAVVDNQRLRGMDTATLYTTLRRLGQMSGRDSTQAAYDAVAEQLVRRTPQSQRFITDLQDLSLALKELKTNPPTAAASTGARISSADLQEAVSNAEGLLRQMHPDFARANTVYRAGTRQIVDPLTEGPVGKMADRNPNLATPTAASKLDNLVGKDLSPEGVTQAAGQLGAGGADLQEIARALMQRKLAGGPARPDAAAFGGVGSGQERNLEALLSAAGRDPQAVRAPLRLADTLADTLPPPNNATEYLSLHPGGINIRGIVRPGAFSGNPAVADAKAQIARLMAGASDEERRQLLQLSRFDPNLRQLLAGYEGMLPLLQQQGEK